MSEDIQCPKCKTTTYRDPSLKLMVNTCGHGVCENCVKLLFHKGSGNCPTCDIPLRRVDYRYQVFQNSYVEKEVDIRRKLLKDFNKKEDEFPTLKEYNDYLEMVETYIYNLANNINVEETKRKIELYKKENQEIINKNRSKKSKDEELIDDMIEDEKQMEVFRKNNHNLLLEREQLNKVKKHQQEKLIDDLMCSDGDAKAILNSHLDSSKRRIAAVQERMAKDEEEKMRNLQQQLSTLQSGGPASSFSTGIKFSKSSMAFQAKPTAETTEIPPIYLFTEDELPSKGPSFPKSKDIDTLGYLRHVRSCETSEKAGGFVGKFPCQRALQEAFCGLYFSPDH